MRQNILPKPHARRTPRYFLEQEQNRFVLSGRQRQGAVMIAQPRDFAELAVLAKGNSILLHGHNMVTHPQYNNGGGKTPHRSTVTTYCSSQCADRPAQPCCSYKPGSSGELRRVSTVECCSSIWVGKFLSRRSRRQDRRSRKHRLVAVWAGDVLSQTTAPHAAAWYKKTDLTFTDAIGAVRLVLRSDDLYRHSPLNPQMHKIPPGRLIRMAQAICFAA